MNGYTAGVELEWADVDRRVQIPETLGHWNDADYTIVNSDGHANDPSGKDWVYGGEINTVPTETADDQADITRQLAALLNPAVNYRCNLHVHVRPPAALQQDVALLKQVATYLRRAEPFVYSVVEPVPRPTREQYPDSEAYAGAMKRYRRRLVSHHYSLPKARFDELIAATTAQGIYDAHAPLGKNGQRNWMVAPRPGMNLRSLWKHGTIEYRHFPGTADPEEVADCVEWALRFTEAAINGAPSAPQILASKPTWRFPEFRAYDHDLELGYLATTYKPGATRLVRVHRQHQPVASSASVGASDIGGSERRFEWDIE